MPEATHALIETLSRYFPSGIARAVVRSTLRRGGLPEEGLDEVDLDQFVSALEQTLPMYIVDPQRRGECIGSVRDLIPHSQRGPLPSPRPRSPLRDTPRPAPDPVLSGPGEPRGHATDGDRTPGGTVRVRSARDVVHACDLARETARGLGFSLLDQTKIATAASELARNIVLYVGDGELRVAALVAPRGIQITAADTGSGIADVALVMNAGYRSRTGMGMGLKGTKRLMDSLEIQSRVGVGTTVVARKLVP
jgi:serine/threonine-protein kinase RsbT